MSLANANNSDVRRAHFLTLPFSLCPLCLCGYLKTNFAGTVFRCFCTRFPPMPVLHIALKKISPERAALSCRREDGTVTWSRMQPFFPLHDLTHVAVERTLRLRQAFFGLIAAGWTLEDFSRPGVAARLPTEALQAEVMVGVFDGLGWAPTHAEFSASFAAALARRGLPDLAVSPEDFADIVRQRTESRARWLSLPIGDSLAVDLALP